MDDYSVQKDSAAYVGQDETEYSKKVLFHDEFLKHYYMKSESL